MMYSFLKIDEDYITRNLIDKEPDVMKGYGEKVTYRQLSFFLIPKCPVKIFLDFEMPG